MSAKKEIVCILCPRGCRIPHSTGKKITAEGNHCRRGLDYAVKERTNPERTVTSSVRVMGGELPLASVKTSNPVPKGKIKELMKELKKITVKAPVNIGDVIAKNPADCKTELIATKKISAKIRR